MMRFLSALEPKYINETLWSARDGRTGSVGWRFSLLGMGA